MSETAMPCSYYSDSEIIDQTRRELNETTRLLYAVIESLNENSVRWLRQAVPGLSSWWAAHQELDRQRRDYEERAAVDERIRKAALEKLSFTERQALGLADR